VNKGALVGWWAAAIALPVMLSVVLGSLYLWLGTRIEVAGHGLVDSLDEPLSIVVSLLPYVFVAVAVFGLVTFVVLRLIERAGAPRSVTLVACATSLGVALVAWQRVAANELAALDPAVFAFTAVLPALAMAAASLVCFTWHRQPSMSGESLGVVAATDGDSA
jgi:hypothetical protein